MVHLGGTFIPLIRARIGKGSLGDQQLRLFVDNQEEAADLAGDLGQKPWLKAATQQVTPNAMPKNECLVGWMAGYVQRWVQVQ